MNSMEALDRAISIRMFDCFSTPIVKEWAKCVGCGDMIKRYAGHPSAILCDACFNWNVEASYIGTPWFYKPSDEVPYVRQSIRRGTIPNRRFKSLSEQLEALT